MRVRGCEGDLGGVVVLIRGRPSLWWGVRGTVEAEVPQRDSEGEKSA